MKKFVMSVAALHSGSKTYFFSGDQYIRVTRGNSGAGTIDPGYPKNISVWGWPSDFAPNGIDAALYSGTKTYFFAGDQYIRVSRGSTGAGTVDSSYPRNISVWGWPNGFAESTQRSIVPGVDAALHSGSKTYLFSGDQYIRVSRGNSGAGTIDSGYPKSISVWGWPSDFAPNGIDAALYSGTKTYFFAGDQYIRVSRGSTGAGTVDSGYPRNISVWDWPNGFHTEWTNVGGNYWFSQEITADQTETLLMQHRRGFQRAEICNSLTAGQRQALLRAYRRPIRHGITANQNVNASAFVGLNEIFVNFQNLFPQGNDEIAQTLIHEMMHCAGFTHPLRTTADVPGDNGPYYGSPPLQSELCIAGQQSDKRCIEDADGVCKIIS